jgi:hypothetical protein
MSELTRFDDSESALLRAILNRLVPASDVLPAAGNLGVARTVEDALAGRAGDRRIFLDGLAAVDRASWQANDQAFGAIEPNQQDAILQGVERDRPDFFELLVRLTYRGYYGSAEIKAALGIETRAPQPLGFVLPAFRAELLDQVRARGAVYRKVEE